MVVRGRRVATLRAVFGAELSALDRLLSITRERFSGSESTLLRGHVTPSVFPFNARVIFAYGRPHGFSL